MINLRFQGVRTFLLEFINRLPKKSIGKKNNFDNIARQDLVSNVYLRIHQSSNNVFHIFREKKSTTQK